MASLGRTRQDKQLHLRGHPGLTPRESPSGGIGDSLMRQSPMGKTPIAEGDENRCCGIRPNLGLADTMLGNIAEKNGSMQQFSHPYLRCVRT